MRPLQPDPPPYKDREHAGRALARELAAHTDEPNLLVLALPRGGVAVGAEVAQALRAPLDIWVVRKLGLPEHPEFAMGAIASGGVRVMNPLPGMHISPEAMARVLAQEEAELARRERVYRGDHPSVSAAGRHVILVDDGLATGATLRAAALAVRAQHPSRLTVAVPVGSRQGCESLADVADEVVCPLRPEPFRAVSLWYKRMPQASDEEVRELLDRAWHEHARDLRLGTPPRVPGRP